MVQVKVEEGILEGELEDTSEYGVPYYSFKGIPYAEPPIGKLRFKPPLPKQPWQGIRTAKECGSPCYQRDIFDKTKIGGSEDCLYLNVYSPDIKPDKPLPVMFWIHGGGFVGGNSNDDVYGPEFLVRHGVILVTFNYRIGALGFLCLDTKDISGNAGMKDQVLALKWVNKNISEFGGDPNNITVFGESAGGASSSFHLISPMSKGLFKRAIAQSGVSVSSWAIMPFARENALVLARQLGNYSEDDEELHKFFINQPVDVFVDLNLAVTSASAPFQLSFAVVSEKDFGSERFFFGDPIDYLRNDIQEDVDVMAGYTEDEGLYGFYADPTPEGLEKILTLANNYLDVFVPKRIANECPFDKHLVLGRKIKKHYFENKIVSNDTIDNFINYLNMEFFYYDIILFAKLMGKNNKVYLYKFTCQSERNQSTNLLGISQIYNKRPVVCHGDDLPYLFPVKVLPQKIAPETFRCIDNVTKLWTNFAKFGNPTPDETLGIKWIPFKPDDQDYLEIGNRLAAKTFPEKEDFEFYESIFREYLPRCLA